jgi:hypothetical protein
LRIIGRLCRCADLIFDDLLRKWQALAAIRDASKGFIDLDDIQCAAPRGLADLLFANEIATADDHPNLHIFEVIVALLRVRRNKDVASVEQQSANNIPIESASCSEAVWQAAEQCGSVPVST